MTVDEPVRCQDGEAYIMGWEDSDRLRIRYNVDFPGTPIGHQHFEYEWPADALDGGSIVAAAFAERVAPARTFTTEAAAQTLQRAGLGQGGSLDNALVCDSVRWLNPPLRFVNEHARHKFLDLMGDLALMGRPLGPMRVVAHKAGHALHVAFAREILAQEKTRATS